MKGMCLALFGLVVIGCSQQFPTGPTPTATTAATLSAVLAQSAPESNDQLVIPPQYSDINGNPATDPDTPLYRRTNAAGAIFSPPFPIYTPDGDLVTLSEYMAVEGSASVKCIPEGTHVVVHMTGLIPKGLYTVWMVAFHTPGAPLASAGVGALGTSDGSQNIFRASSAGTGSISGIAPGGPLSFRGTIANCALTDEAELHVVGAYHIDQTTWGPAPGNGPGTFIEQFAFIFN